MILDKPSLPKFNSESKAITDLPQLPKKNWDSRVVTRMIRENSTYEISPAFLYLGRIETELLRDHLAQAFGAASVSTLNETYYMGLKVVSVDADSYILTGGKKMIRSSYLPSPLASAS